MKFLAVFGPYEASCMATSKWDALHHLMDALQHGASIEYVVTAYFKSSHRRSKKCYRLVSKPMQRCMTVTLEIKLKN